MEILGILWRCKFLAIGKFGGAEIVLPPRQSHDVHHIRLLMPNQAINIGYRYAYLVIKLMDDF